RGRCWPFLPFREATAWAPVRSVQLNHSQFQKDEQKQGTHQSLSVYSSAIARKLPRIYSDGLMQSPWQSVHYIHPSERSHSTPVARFPLSRLHSMAAAALLPLQARGSR
uniref:Uncharacterized protein n=1 Tax=Aegilops tauschii subsp. strangulata TaxID=200361 RepID=A0A452XNC7_AEGTS